MLTQQAQTEVRDMIHLLMQRPISERLAMRIEAMEGFHHLEISHGEWIGFEEDMYMGGEEHGRIEFKLILRLGNHVEAHNLGVLYTGDTDFVLDGDAQDIRIKRRPDIAFVTTSRFVPSKGYIYGAPDLAIEIISPTERPQAIRQKLAEYLQYGVQQVWHVYPDSQEIVIHYPDHTSRTFHAEDTLTGGALLPGFTLKVATLFTV
jgi:Uma2 family endonuclease